MGKKLKTLLPTVAFSLIPTLLIWLPFFLRLKKFWTIPLPQEGMASIVANYDGPLYIVVAKTLYNPELVGNFSFTLPAEYYAAHFPLFPLLVRLVAILVGFPYAMLFVTLITSAIAIYFFQMLVKEYVKKENVLWLTFVFSIFPARWLIVRSVGSAEPLFLATTMASIYYFNRKKYLKSGICGSLAMLTKSPGILLFLSFFLGFFIPQYKKLATTDFSKWIKSLGFKKYAQIGLIPLSLLGLFIFYKIQFNDFLAYFHSGDNIHLFFPPFQIFNFSQPWVGTFWLEEIIFVYLFGILGFLKLVKKTHKKPQHKTQNYQILAWFVGIFFISTIFVSHRDLIRYSLPMLPFLLIAFSKELAKKEFKIALATLIIPIYLFSLAYISQNVMPVSDWAPLL